MMAAEHVGVWRMKRCSAAPSRLRACLAWLQLQIKQLHSRNPGGAGSEWSWSCLEGVFG